MINGTYYGLNEVDEQGIPLYLKWGYGDPVCRYVMENGDEVILRMTLEQSGEMERYRNHTIMTQGEYLGIIMSWKRKYRSM